MTDLSTTYPHEPIPDPQFSLLHFTPEVDRLGDWQAHTYPGRRVQLTRLHKREEFTPSSGYGRNGWGELYKGETIAKLYVPLSETLVANYNVLVEYNGASMVVCRYAQPDFVKPRRMSEPELMNYYRWMGSY